MKIKKSAFPGGIKPELLLGLSVANDVYSKFGYELVVTSLNDSKHSRTSLHYVGQAADLRTRHMPLEVAKDIVEELKNSLPDEYDIILESDHIHVEWQPKRAAR